MSLFSLNWFRSTKREEELAALKVEEQRIKNEILRKELFISAPPVIDYKYVVGADPYKERNDFEKQSKKFEDVKLVEEKLYKTVKMVNDILIVVFNDGCVLSKSEATVNDFEKIRNAVTHLDIIAVMSSDQYVEEQRKHESNVEDIKTIYKGFDVLDQFSDFEVKDNCVYLKGTGRTIPELLVNKFSAILGTYIEDYNVQQIEELLLENDEYQGLKRFFLWCCLNPRAEVADQLYGFLMKNDFKITKQGFFVALRNVVRANDTDQHDLVDFISNAYNKVKAVWKKKPCYYDVYKTEEGYTFHLRVHEDIDVTYPGELVGSLDNLYENLPEMDENRYTDNWSHTFDIRIGKVVSMPKEACDWSTYNCARAGLHFAGHTAPYVLCGDTTIFTLHNPMKVVGIGTEKGRCWEYLPFMTTTVDEADAIMNSGDFDFLQLDEQYAIDELNELNEKVKQGFAVETTKHQFNLPQISTEEIHNIVKSLEEMKTVISKRIVDL